MIRDLLALKLLLAGVLVGLVTACAPGPSLRESHGDLPAAEGEMGRIYFYRPAELLMSAVEADVVVNSKKVGSLGPGTAFFRDALPGRYEVRLAGEPDEPVEFAVSSGSLTFIEVLATMDAGGFQFEAQQVPAQQARPVILELTLIDPAAAQ